MSLLFNVLLISTVSIFVNAAEDEVAKVTTTSTTAVPSVENHKAKTAPTVKTPTKPKHKGNALQQRLNNAKADEIVDKFNERYEALFNKGDAKTIAEELYEDNAEFFVNSKKFLRRNGIEKFYKKMKDQGQKRLVFFPRHVTMDDVKNIYTTGEMVIYDKHRKVVNGAYTQTLRLESGGKYRVHVEFQDYIKA